MTVYKRGDRVIVTIDGHDTEWTVTDEWSGCAGAKPTVSRPGMHLSVDVGALRPVPMEEPTEIGARIVIEPYMRLIRYTDQTFRHGAWINENGVHWPWAIIAKRNPRPYTGGDNA
jgi:hypothetical protein